MVHLQEGADETKEGEAAEGTEATTTDAAAEAGADNEVLPLTDITNKKISTDDGNKASAKNNQQRQRRERGPPADGIPSKTKVMVANLPYDLTEEKVSTTSAGHSLRSTGGR